MVFVFFIILLSYLLFELLSWFDGYQMDKFRKNDQSWISFRIEVYGYVGHVSFTNPEIGSELSNYISNISTDSNIKRLTPDMIMEYRCEICSRWGKYLSKDDYNKLKVEVREFKLKQLI